MPFDHNGQLVEAVDCASCNSSLEWHGRLPEDPDDIVCNDCNTDRLTARAEKAEAALMNSLDVVQGAVVRAERAEAEVERLRAALEKVLGTDCSAACPASGVGGIAWSALRSTSARPAPDE